MVFCGTNKRLGSAASVDRRVIVSPSYYSFDVLVIVALQDCVPAGAAPHIRSARHGALSHWLAVTSQKDPLHLGTENRLHVDGSVFISSSASPFSLRPDGGLWSPSCSKGPTASCN